LGEDAGDLGDLERVVVDEESVFREDIHFLQYLGDILRFRPPVDAEAHEIFEAEAVYPDFFEILSRQIFIILGAYRKHQAPSFAFEQGFCVANRPSFGEPWADIILLCSDAYPQGIIEIGYDELDRLHLLIDHAQAFVYSFGDGTVNVETGLIVSKPFRISHVCIIVSHESQYVIYFYIIHSNEVVNQLGKCIVQRPYDAIRSPISVWVDDTRRGDGRLDEGKEKFGNGMFDGIANFL